MHTAFSRSHKSVRQGKRSLGGKVGFRTQGIFPLVKNKEAVTPQNMLNLKGSSAKEYYR